MPAEWETWRRVEHGASGPLLARSWVVEVEPPFRTGNGFRIRLGSRAFHLGVCRPAPDSGPLGLLGGAGVGTTPEDIGKWIPNEVEAQETADA